MPFNNFPLKPKFNIGSTSRGFISTLDHFNSKRNSRKVNDPLMRPLVLKQLENMAEAEDENSGGSSGNISKTSIIENIPEENDEELKYRTPDERSWRDVNSSVYKFKRTKFILNYEEFEVSVESERESEEVSGSTSNHQNRRRAHTNFTQIHLFSANHISSMTETRKGVPSFDCYDAAEGKPKKKLNFYFF